MISDRDLELIEKLKQLGKDLGRKPTRDEFRDSGVPNSNYRHLTFNGLLKLAGFELHPNQKATKIEAFDPVIVILDIEVAPLKLWSYGIREQYHGTESIDEDWTILSFAAKELNKEEIVYHAVSPDNPRDDEMVVREAFFLLNRADIIICHNAAFDIKMLQARFLFYDLPVRRPTREICTLRIARKHFRLTSNKLEYLAKYLKVIEKLDHAKFAGMKLFKECAKGNPEAFQELFDYNVRDVITTEACYLRLRKFDKSIRFNVFYQDNICDCGSTEMRRIDPIATNIGIFKVHQCVECGKIYREKENLLSNDLRKHLMI